MAIKIDKPPELVQLKPPALPTREDLRRLLLDKIRRNEALRKAKLR